MNDKRRVVVVGAGAWGTALAEVMANSSNQVTLLAQTANHAREINALGENKTYLPGFNLNPALTITSDEAILTGADFILWVIPTQYTRQSLTTLRPHINPAVPVIICSKGVDCTKLPITKDSLLTSMIGGIIANPLGVLSGPNFAREVASGLYAATCLAASSLSTATEWAGILSTTTFTIVPSDDKIGVQIAGSLKNVIAIASGLLIGKQAGQNANAALLTRGMNEIKNLAVAMGGKVETFLGLAGMGDLVLTCTSLQSRNTNLGLKLSQGEALDNALGNQNSISEGAYTARAAHDLARHYGVPMPICNGVYHMLNNNVSVEKTINNLLQNLS